ncbi:MAG: hypothetical protein WBB55_05895 [Anaerolineales bacterium]
MNQLGIVRHISIRDEIVINTWGHRMIKFWMRASIEGKAGDCSVLQPDDFGGM